MAASSRAVERLSGSQRNLADRLPRPRTDKMIGLHRGDPSFDTPRYIVDAAVEAMNQGFTHYPPPQGDPALREAIAVYQSAVSGVSVDPSHVLVTSGGTGAVYAGMVAYLNEGDELLLLDPTYSLYSDVARVVGARIVSVPLAGDFSVDLEAVRRSVTPRTRMMVLNFPSNPTGQQLKQHELDGLAAIAAEHDLLVLSDEVYDQLSFKGRHVSALGHPALTDRTILVNSFSKSYAMTGWRVGWVVAMGPLFKAVAAINRTAVGYVNYIAQRAALAALSNGEEDRKWRGWMLGQYEAQRRAMWEQLSRVPGIQLAEPEAAFYAWVRYNAPLSSVEMMKYLYERGLNVRPGTEFGEMGEGYLRFTFAPSVENITQGIEIFRSSLEELRGK